jgi:hypothetical protein
MAELVPTRLQRFRVLWLLAAAVALFAGANAHLVYVAVSSEPGCVTHLKDKSGSPGEYRAAKSAC